MAKEKEVCNAHELLLRNFTSIEEGQAKLYDLDREKADKLTVIEVSVARLEESANAGFKRLETAHNNSNAILSKEIENLSKLVRSMTAQRRWTPKTITVIISTVFGSGGLGYAVGIKILEALK